MQIILVHDRLRQARTIALTGRHLALGVFGASTLLVFGAALLYYATFKVGAALDLPMMRTFVREMTAEATLERERRLRDQVATMAAKLGELQAQMTRLDVIGERVSTLMGFKPQEFGFGQPPGRGGASPAVSSELSFDDLRKQVDAVATQVDERSIDMQRFETALLDRSVASKLTPTNAPVASGFIGSGFGWRIDPFNGRQAKHDGLDFSAPIGTPIKAAAGGIVVAAEPHPEFGNMVDIDHGNGLITRYAHASKLYVKAGDIVKRGDHIADVGTTGRSTGPHLHFEVHVNGVPQNPQKFLTARSLQTAALAAK